MSLPTQQGYYTSMITVSMKTILLFLFTFLAVYPVYADQRLSDIRPGYSCDKIQEIEERLGSLEIVSRDTEGIIEYRGTHGAREAIIVYRCDKGTLTEQKIIVTNTSRDQAYEFADEQKKTLTRIFGSPVHDGLTLSGWKTFYFGFMGADLDYLTGVVVWGTANEDAMLLIREKGADRWEVSVTQGSSKSEFIFNS